MTPAEKNPASREATAAKVNKISHERFVSLRLLKEYAAAVIEYNLMLETCGGPGVVTSMMTQAIHLTMAARNGANPGMSSIPPPLGPPYKIAVATRSGSDWIIREPDFEEAGPEAGQVFGRVERVPQRNGAYIVGPGENPFQKRGIFSRSSSSRLSHTSTTDTGHESAIGWTQDPTDVDSPSAAATPSTSPTPGADRDGANANVSPMPQSSPSHSSDSLGIAPPDSGAIRQELAAVIFDFHPPETSRRAPRRHAGVVGGNPIHTARVQLVLPGINVQTGRPLSHTPTTTEERMLRSAHKSLLPHPMCVAIPSKAPVWSDLARSYVLNFRGRVTLASVKNMLIIHPRDPDYVILQIGRAAPAAHWPAGAAAAGAFPPGTLVLDYRFPLTAVQALGVALACLDNASPGGGQSQMFM
ncbi:hypothetical protein H696_01784 [Fonticula alba]|uniref:Tubby C-terminal domain-containing protein n=1 Tax=Fonticula alba TaxID=691883 RepID=A0A058ZDC5_FONAL|nr:hypothetical protein H696_01784 [Fonticula alba]KCV72389.1 hypothetical protein H696_01784 [Fonticula alba]|eukprot:XP_009493967.1 hypothetical protein H696_01784 [Fonticula alba]